MKTIKYLLIFAIGFSSLTSCVDDFDPSAANDQGNNVAGFLQTTQSIGGISNGDTYDHDIKFSVKGPTSGQLSSDIVVTFDADPSSTAIEGTHFAFASKSITLSNANNYLGELPVTMLTEGIQAPLDVSPILYLKVTDAATGENVVGDGKLLKITMNYLCFSQLAGFYYLTLDRDNGATVIFPDEEIFELSPGSIKLKEFTDGLMGLLHLIMDLTLLTYVILYLYLTKI